MARASRKSLPLVRYAGSAVRKDVAIYSRSGEPLTGLTRDILAARTRLISEAKAPGFKQLQITGQRVPGSTSANPGKLVDITVDLTSRDWGDEKKKDLGPYVQESRDRLAHGLSTDDLIAWLQSRGLTITESMKVLMQACNLSLGEAKRIVSAHPIWADVVKSADALHEELERLFRREEHQKRNS